MKNKKGFTMVELLATVTILGILMVVSIGSISMLMKKGKTNYYSTQRKNLISAAKSYYNDNKQLLPKNVGGQETVTLQTLNQQKYIGKVYDSNKKECTGNTTIVVVTLESKGKYTYKSYLDCPGIPKETPEETTIDDSQFEYQVQTVTAGQTYNVLIKSKNTIKIISYEYSVLKNGYVEQKASGTANDTTVTTKNFTINEASSVKNNTYTVVLKIVDEKHQTHTGTVTLQLGDNKPPACGTKNTNPNRWVKSNQTVSVACSDTDDLNLPLTCQHDVFKVLLRDDKDLLNYLKTIGGTKKPAITIIDRMGNTTDCDISNDIQIDSTAPTLDVIARKWTGSTAPSSPNGLGAYSWGGWTNTNVFTQATSEDKPPTGLEMIVTSGDVKISYSTSGQVGTQTNKTPTYTNNSSHKKVGYVNISAEGKSTITYKTKDRNNNTRNGSKSNIWIDKTAPNAPTVTMYKWKNNNTKPTSTSGLTKYTSGSWTNLNIYITATATDKAPKKGVEVSGIDHLEYTITGKEPNVSNKSGSSASISTEGTSKIKFRAVDKAGNIGPWSDEYTIKIDKTKPTISFSAKAGTWNSGSSVCNESTTGYTSDTWKNHSCVRLTTVIDDNASGVATRTRSTTGYTNNDNKVTVSATSHKSRQAQGIATITYYAKDNAGNENTQSFIIKLDRTAPTINFSAKAGTWNSSGKTCSENSTSYTSDTWKNHSCVRLTTVIDDSQSGVKTRTRSTTGYSSNDNNETVAATSHKSRQSQGIATITYYAKDNAGNENTQTFTVKLDRTAPTISFSAKAGSWNSSSKTCTESSTGYSSDTWKNHECVRLTTVIDDNASGVSTRSRSTTGYSNNDSNVAVSATSHKSRQAQGTATITYKAKDNAGNEGTSTFTVKLDRTAPTVPTVSGYRTTSTTRSTANDYPYTESSWYKNYVVAIPSGSTDTMSGLGKYQGKSKGPGASSYGSYANVNHINVTSEGTSNVKFRACDKVGNCSDGSSAFTIKLDHTPPAYYTHYTGYNSTYDLNEWHVVYQDPLSGLETTADAGVSDGTSKIYYCYGTSTSCPRHCTKEGKAFDANKYKGTIGDAAGYWLKFARVANRTQYGNTDKDKVTMQTSRGCNGGKYTVIGELHIYDRAGNVDERSLTWTFTS